MTFLAPWALAAGVSAATAMVLLHLVAWQRPAAFMLPTTRFIPDQRTVVSRAATRPRDVLLLLIRVLMLLVAATAFARPVMTPSRGSKTHIVLVDRSRAVAQPADVAARSQAIVARDPTSLVIGFDSSAQTGSLSAALVRARREATRLAERVDSVELVVVSPVASNEIDSATSWLRSQWPGAVTLERVALRADSATAWRLEKSLDAGDPLEPAVRGLDASGGRVVRLVRGALSRADSVLARAGGTVVHWDTAGMVAKTAQGLSVGDEVIVAMVGRADSSTKPALSEAEGLGMTAVVAHWADGSAAAREASLGTGCIREVGVGVPTAGDLSLHAPFQRIVRRLLMPCGSVVTTAAADSVTVARLFGKAGAAAPSSALRTSDAPATPLVKWLLGIAIVLAVLELFARNWMKPAVPA